jgi:hypothetical protein
MATGEQTDGQHRDETAGQAAYQTFCILHKFPLDLAVLALVESGKRCCEPRRIGKQKAMDFSTMS